MYLNLNNENQDYDYLSLFDNRNEQIFLRFKYSTVDISKFSPGEERRERTKSQPGELRCEV